MGHRKKATTRVLAALSAVLLVITGCSNNPTTSSDRVLTVLGVSEAREALDAAIAGFKAENPDVEFSVQYVDETSLTSTLPTQLQAGNAADLFAIWPGTYSPIAAVGLGHRGLLADLSGEPWIDRVPASFGPYIGSDGGIFYPPLGSLSVIAMYNQTAMDELGSTIPETKDEVFALCASAAAAGRIPYALGAQTDWQNQMLAFILSATLVDRVDPEFLTRRAAGTATFLDSPWRDVFAQINDMHNAGCFSSPLGTSFEVATTQVASGEALALFSVSSTFAQVQEAAGDNVIVGAAIPATNNADETWIPVAPGASYGVNAKAKELDLAKAFIDFLMEPENSAAYALASGQVPALGNEAFEATPASAVQLEFAALGRTAPVADQLFPTPKIRDAWISTAQAMLAGQATPEDVVKAMDAAWDAG